MAKRTKMIADPAVDRVWNLVSPIRLAILCSPLLEHLDGGMKEPLSFAATAALPCTHSLLSRIETRSGFGQLLERLWLDQQNAHDGSATHTLTALKIDLSCSTSKTYENSQF